MEKGTLDILAEAISDVGSWQWWYTVKDMFQMEFRDVELYDTSTPEKGPHSSTIAVRFFNNSFAAFLDNREEESGKKWYDRFYDDEIPLIQVEPYELVFDDVDYAKKVLDGFKNRISMKDFEGIGTLSSAKHILAAKCEGVGFIVGVDVIKVVGKNGEYAEEEIESLAKQWWEYWRNYWRCRKTKDAYEEDWVCEVTIPVNPDDPKGEYCEEGSDSEQLK